MQNFSETSRNTNISVEALFSMALEQQAEKKFSESKDKCEAVKVQASTCTVGEWSSFLNILALATVISRPLSSVYPDFNFCYRQLLHRTVMPRLPLFFYFSFLFFFSFQNFIIIASQSRCNPFFPLEPCLVLS